MNQPTEPLSEARAIRSQIDDTRHRMDETIGALGERLSGRHLVDEALHFFRTQNENGNMNKFKQKISTSANTVVHSVVDTVKANPLPAALIGAGVAWFIYNQSHRSTGNGSYYGSASDPEGYGNYYGESYARDASDLGISSGDVVGSGEGLKGKAMQLQERSKEALHAAGARIQEVGGQVRERAHELGDRSRQMVRQGRQRVVSTMQQHPLESGLACLAVGLIAGLALPTSSRVRRTLAPRARQLRERAEDVVQRGRVVIQHAAEAAKAEAEAQGFVRSRNAGAGAEAGARPAGNLANAGNSPEALPPASGQTAGQTGGPEI